MEANNSNKTKAIIPLLVIASCVCGAGQFIGIICHSTLPYFIFTLFFYAAVLVFVARRRHEAFGGAAFWIIAAALVFTAAMMALWRPWQALSVFFQLMNPPLQIFMEYVSLLVSLVYNASVLYCLIWIALGISAKPQKRMVLRLLLMLIVVAVLFLGLDRVISSQFSASGAVSDEAVFAMRGTALFLAYCVGYYFVIRFFAGSGDLPLGDADRFRWQKAVRPYGSALAGCLVFLCIYPAAEALYRPLALISYAGLLVLAIWFVFAAMFIYLAVRKQMTRLKGWSYFAIGASALVVSVLYAFGGLSFLLPPDLGQVEYPARLIVGILNYVVYGCAFFLALVMVTRKGAPGTRLGSVRILALMAGAAVAIAFGRLAFIDLYSAIPGIYSEFVYTLFGFLFPASMAVVALIGQLRTARSNADSLGDLGEKVDGTHGVAHDAVVPNT